MPNNLHCSCKDLIELVDVVDELSLDFTLGIISML